MPFLFVEQHQANRPITLEANGSEASTRTFKVTTTNDISAVRADFNNQPGLRLHPANPLLRFIGATFSPSESGAGVLVQVNYGTNTGSRFSQPQRDDPAYYHWHFAYREVTVDIPIAVRIPVLVDTGGAGETRLLWTAVFQKVAEKRLVYELNLEIARPPGNYVTAFEYAVSQKDTIHTIGSKRVRMTGFEAREVDGLKLDVRYSWEVDNGTPVPVGGVNIISPADSNQTGDELLRNPYSVVQIIPSSDPAAGPPKAVSLYPYAENPNGWRQLLGADRIQ